MVRYTVRFMVGEEGQERWEDMPAEGFIPAYEYARSVLRRRESARGMVVDILDADGVIVRVVTRRDA
jgi:hypothetical protein